MPWLTPDDPPTGEDCAEIRVPSDPRFRAFVRGALLSLTLPANWEAYGDMTPDETAELFTDILNDFDNSWQECP